MSSINTFSIDNLGSNLPCTNYFLHPDLPKHRVPPADRFYLAYFFLLLHGIGFLLPWNVFVNAQEYFVDYKLNTTTSRDADYRTNFMSYIGFASFMPCLCFSAWNTFHRSKSSSASPRFRFLLAMFVEIFVLVFTVVLTLVDTSQIPGVFFAFTIGSIVCINCCVGIHQTMTFGMAAQLPMKYSNAVVIGSNACGTIIALVNIMTKGIATAMGKSHKSIIISTVAYFSSAILIVVACLFTFFWLRRLEFFQYYYCLVRHGHISVTPPESIPNGDKPDRLDAGPSGEPVGMESNGVAGSLAIFPTTENGAVAGSQPESQSLLLSMQSRDRACPDSTLDATESVWTVLRNCFGLCCFAPPTGRARCSAYWSWYIACFSECYVHCISVWSIFFCSLSTFPAILSLIKPVDPHYFIPRDWFTDITCFLFFNLFAMLGCIVCNWVQFPGPRFLWIPVWLRTFFFIPFFLFCNVVVPGSRRIPVLVANDHVYVFAAVIFAFTNGYFSSLCMMYAPRNSPPERMETAGMLASFFLVFGVFSGVYASRVSASIVMG